MIEIEENRKKYKGITPKILVKKEDRYCKQCGKKIENKGKYFCSVDCSVQYQRNQKGYTAEDIIEASKKCSTIEELGRCFNITGGAIKKRMKAINKLDEVKENLRKNKPSYTILQYDLNNVLIREWANAQDASKELNINKNHIYTCCRGGQKTCGGYIWKFKNK